MKKTLLKASLICLGILLLCGMSSFKTSERVKSQPLITNDTLVTFEEDGAQQSFQIATIVYDSVITTDGEDLQNIKEVVVDGDKGVCSCTLYVSNSGSIWTLYIYYHNVSCDNSKNVYAEYSYIESFANKPQKTIHCTRSMPLRVGDNQVASGSLTGDNRSMCIPKSIKAWACFDNANQN